MYIEASSPRVKGQRARLASRWFQPNAFKNGACVNFWYHMYGQGIGDLDIYVRHYGTNATRAIDVSVCLLFIIRLNSIFN